MGISNEDFFNKAAKGLNQKLQEAWVLARLGIAISNTISPVTLSVVDAPMLDGVIHFSDGRNWECEAVAVHRLERKLGDDYRRGQQPVPPLSDFSGQVSDPTRPREEILKKVRKALAHGVRRHLYRNA